MLFQTAVLHWDMKSERAFADGPMVQMAEQVVNIYSKSESLPAKYRLTPTENLPVASEPGPFTMPPVADKRPAATCDKKKPQGSSTLELTMLQSRLLTVLRETQSLDKGLRNLKAGVQVHIPDKNTSSGKTAALDDLQKEFNKWFEKTSGLESELASSKNQRQTAFEVQVEQLTAKCAEKDQQIKQHITRVHKLESDVQGWKYDLTNLRREKMELAEKNAKMAKEDVPVVEKIRKLLDKSREAVERLTKDAERLSRMFQLQVEENRKIVEEKDEIEKDLAEVHRQLALEKDMIEEKEANLKKKETLYLRTMAARKCIHEAYLEDEAKIAEVEQRMRQREADCQEMSKVLEGRDSEIKQLEDELGRARRRIEELEQQGDMCMEAFHRETGRPGHTLLQRFKANPTLGASSLSAG